MESSKSITSCSPNSKEVGVLKNYDTAEEIKSAFRKALREAKEEAEPETYSDEECPDIMLRL